jgi:hypothetical protein
MRDIHGMRYLNCGDWVESCTALVEDEHGRFEILDWSRTTTPATVVPLPEPVAEAEPERGAA